MLDPDNILPFLFCLAFRFLEDPPASLRVADLSAVGRPAFSPRSDRYEIDLVFEDGSVLRIRREVEPVTMSGAEWRAHEAERVWWLWI